MVDDVDRFHMVGCKLPSCNMVFVVIFPLRSVDLRMRPRRPVPVKHLNKKRSWTHDRWRGGFSSPGSTPSAKTGDRSKGNLAGGASLRVPYDKVELTISESCLRRKSLVWGGETLSGCREGLGIFVRPPAQVHGPPSNPSSGRRLKNVLLGESSARPRGDDPNHPHQPSLAGPKIRP